MLLNPYTKARKGLPAKKLFYILFH